jgi:hypothetical protein
MTTARILHALAGTPEVDGCEAEELTRTEFIESAVEERLERGEG